MIKAFDLRSDVHLHVWVRIPLFAITFFCLMIWKHALFMPKFAQARFFQNLHIHLIMTSLKSLRVSRPKGVRGLGSSDICINTNIFLIPVRGIVRFDNGAIVGKPSENSRDNIFYRQTK